jgi:hypothetical protein
MITQQQRHTTNNLHSYEMQILEKSEKNPIPSSALHKRYRFFSQIKGISYQQNIFLFTFRTKAYLFPPAWEIKRERRNKKRQKR